MCLFFKDYAIEKLDPRGKAAAQTAVTSRTSFTRVMEELEGLRPRLKKLLEEQIKSYGEKIKVLEELLRECNEGDIKMWTRAYDLTIDELANPSADRSLLTVITDAERMKKIEEIHTKLSDQKFSVLPLFEAYSKSKQHFESDDSLAKLSDSVMLFTVTGASWSFDPLAIHADLELSESNMTLSKRTTPTIRSTALGSRAFSRGIHIWEIRQNTANPQCVAFGVIDKQVVNRNYVDDYGSSISYVTTGTYYNMKGTVGVLAKGKSCILTLDCDEGRFFIRGEGIDITSTLDLKGKTVFPYVNMCTYGNSITLKVIK
jgi:hypothetical protein